MSAIVAVRDGERYLAEAIESILAQTPGVDEVIVVDDGSSDTSAAIAESFGDPVTCASQPPSGLAAALNNGVGRANGELISFLDSDDLWPAGRLQAQLAAFDRNPGLDLVFGQTEQFVSPELDAEARARIRNEPGVGRGLLRGAMLARASAFERVGGFDERWTVGEFVDWQARADDLGLRGETLPVVVLRRRLHDSHMTGSGRGHSDYVRIVAEARARRGERPKG